MATVFSLQFLSVKATVKILLDHEDQHSLELRQNAKHLIKRLSTQCFTAVSIDVLETFVNQHPRLLTGELLDVLAAPHMNKLCLNQCSRILCHQGELRYVKNVMKKCNRLQQLELNGCHPPSTTTSELCNMIGQYLHNLTSLSFEACETLSNENVQSILLNCQSLSQLNLAMCPGITDQVFNIQRPSVPSSVETTHGSGCTSPGQHLTSVDLSCNQNLTSTCIRHLVALCGGSLQALNVSCTGMDCTLLWYLCGYSWYDAVELASTFNSQNTSGCVMSNLIRDYKSLKAELHKQLLSPKDEEPVGDGTIVQSEVTKTIEDEDVEFNQKKEEHKLLQLKDAYIAVTEQNKRSTDEDELVCQPTKDEDVESSNQEDDMRKIPRLKNVDRAVTQQNENHQHFSAIHEPMKDDGTGAILKKNDVEVSKQIKEENFESIKITDERNILRFKEDDRTVTKQNGGQQNQRASHQSTRYDGAVPPRPNKNDGAVPRPNKNDGKLIKPKKEEDISTHEKKNDKNEPQPTEDSSAVTKPTEPGGALPQKEAATPSTKEGDKVVPKAIVDDNVPSGLKENDKVVPQSDVNENMSYVLTHQQELDDGNPLQIDDVQLTFKESLCFLEKVNTLPDYLRQDSGTTSSDCANTSPTSVSPDNVCHSPDDVPISPVNDKHLLDSVTTSLDCAITSPASVNNLPDDVCHSLDDVHVSPVNEKYLLDSITTSSDCANTSPASVNNLPDDVCHSLDDVHVSPVNDKHLLDSITTSSDCANTSPASVNNLPDDVSHSQEEVSLEIGLISFPVNVNPLVEACPPLMSNDSAFNRPNSRISLSLLSHHDESLDRLVSEFVENMLEQMTQPDNNPDIKKGDNVADTSAQSSYEQEFQEDSTRNKASDESGSAEVNSFKDRTQRCKLIRKFVPNIKDLDISNIDFDDGLGEICFEEFLKINNCLLRLNLSWKAINDELLSSVQDSLSNLRWLSLVRFLNTVYFINSSSSLSTHHHVKSSGFQSRGQEF